VAGVQVREQAWLRGFPAQQGAGRAARRGVVEPGDVRDQPEALGGLRGVLAHDGHVEVSADDLGDLPKRHPLLGDGVQS
jgi:hypothetical protein